MANVELRRRIQTSLCRQWEIADEIGINEATLSRMLRHELNPEMRERIEDAIDMIQNRRKENLNAKTIL